MNRPRLLVLAVVLTLALAGCSALPMWDDGSSPSAEADTPTPTADGVPEADPGADGGDGPDVAYPDGYAADGVDDPDAALTAHVETLVETDGYTFTYDALITEGDAESAVGIVHHADNVNGTGYEVHNRPDGSVVGYYEDDRRYVRMEQGDEVQYNSTDFEYGTSRFTGYQYVGPLLAQVEYHDAEVIETDEGRFYHYVSESVPDPQEILRSEVDEDRIDRFDVAILVDEDGVVRHANFVVSADRDVSVTMDVGQIDSTNVDRPEWFDEANDA